MNNPYFGKCRGWSAETAYDEWGVQRESGGWVYGSYYFEPMILVPQLWDHYIIIYDGDRYFSEAHPKSLAMYTGQEDKNGKPIFGSFPLPDGTMSKGGDIVSYKDQHTFVGHYPYTFKPSQSNSPDKDMYNIKIDVVTFQNGEFSPREQYYDCDDPYYSFRTYDLKIIGNAYENRTLLEVKQ